MKMRELNMSEVLELKTMFAVYDFYNEIVEEVNKSGLEGINAISYIEDKYRDKNYFMNKITEYAFDLKDYEDQEYFLEPFAWKNIKIINKIIFDRILELWECEEIEKKNLRDKLLNLPNEYENQHGYLKIENSKVLTEYTKEELSFNAKNSPFNEYNIDEYIEYDGADYYEFTLNFQEVKDYIESNKEDEEKLKILLYLTQEAFFSYDADDHILGLKIEKDYVKMTAKDFHFNSYVKSRASEYAFLDTLSKYLKVTEDLIIFQCKWDVFFNKNKMRVM